MKSKPYPKSLSRSIACNRGTLSLTSPRRGSKLLKNKSQEPAGSDCPLLQAILRESEWISFYHHFFRVSFKVYA